MTAQPEDAHEIIHLGGEAAVIVPLEEYRTLKALRDNATPDAIELAEMDAAIAEHQAWEAAGAPGGYLTHEEVMAELLTEPQP
ncbi:MAG TPA: hypothetical protein VFB06_11220 [Streptosporangiaceae bacterium]|nr:hypothetical protein [Streptosporangiaceae bacterium]